MDIMNEDIIAVLPIVNTLALIITIKDEDVYYQWSNEDKATKAQLEYSDEGGFFVIDDEPYYISDFVKIDQRKFEVRDYVRNNN